jgi:hypothetical protein
MPEGDAGGQFAHVLPTQRESNPGPRQRASDWIAQQLTEAFAWRNAPRDVVRDRDRCPVHSARAGHGHSGSADPATLATAKWIRGKARPCLLYLLTNALLTFDTFFKGGKSGGMAANGLNGRR